MGWEGVFLMTLLGLAFGSFAALVRNRMPLGRSILWPGSRCDHCDHTLSPLELVPVLSYLMLRGQCRMCRQRIPPADFLIELLTGAATGTAAWLWGWSAGTLMLVLALLGALGLGWAGRRARRRLSEAGFTLVEAVAAVALLLAVVVPFMRFAIESWRVQNHAHTHIALASLAKQKMDEIQAGYEKHLTIEPGDWQCQVASGSKRPRDIEWRWKEGWRDDSGVSKWLVEVRRKPCDGLADPHAPPSPTESFWAILYAPP